MTKKHNKRRNKSTGKHRIPIVERDDKGGDDLYDEIDNFHRQQDEELLKLVRQPAKPLAREVLRVRVDEEEDDEMEEDNEEFGDEDEEAETSEADPSTAATTNRWGKRRRNYYGASYVDKDFGGVNDSEEEEMLELEEEDALNRQKLLETANSMVNFDRLIGDLESGGGEDGGETDIGKVLQIYHPRSKPNSEAGNQHKEAEVGQDLDAENDDQDSEDSIAEEPPICESDGPKGISNEKRRKITYEIRKNKGIRKDKGRRKGKHQHSRVMKRSQYQKALIKRRSQVPDLRREMTKYDGEKRGIRVSTVRSIKF